MLDGNEEGLGVDFPGKCVGSKVGIAVGTADGVDVGVGVDLPGM